ncbi:MAG: hypothetical protein U9O87_05555 [Verrucomicrobiota bacterium]|nr:hypothetical protein [Verrucomicrobiota bacterium]
MDTRLVNYSIDTIAAETRDIAEFLTEKCNGSPKYIVRAVITREEKVTFVLQRRSGASPDLQYVLSEYNIKSTSDLTEMINQRWLGYYKTIGLIDLGGISVGVFEKEV